ncbi:MAG: sulfatase-like hydrolase/transferase, partial [Bacilli bacterium]|nr:sulfatase-like hydrolase/transferase [Bacilli bacterium]
EDNFKEWISFVKHILNREKDVEIIIDNSLNYDAEKVLKQVEEQYSSFLSDKKNYINSIFEQKTNHPLFKISQYTQDNKIKNKEFIKQFQEKYRSLFERIDKTHKKLNKKNCKHKFAGVRRKLGFFIIHPGKGSLKDLAKAVLIWKEIYKDSDLFDRIGDNYETFKNAPSFKKHIDHYINWEKSRTSNTPSFSCIHVDDIHNPEMFFTYDSEDMSLIDEEMRDVEDVLNNLPEKYYGNITHDLSLRYIDSKLKYFFDKLKEINKSDDTIVLICADHGFSFSGNPIRDSQITNLYLENYNIPCIVFGSGYSKEVDTLYSSKDIPFILHALVGGKIPTAFDDGINSFSGREFLSIEYCGGGCPVIKRRELKMAAFNKEWFVGSMGKIDSKIVVTETYNLKKDPKQSKNLIRNKSVISNNAIDELISKIEERRMAIKKL